jgi:deoxyribodipyrimidine photolyase-related protein
MLACQSKAMAKTLRLILGDQLNINHSWFKKVSADVLYVMMEVHQEATYVTHHIQKITGFFAAMREFAAALTQNGHEVIYLKISDQNNHQDICKNLNEIIRKEAISAFNYQEPDEYRLDEYMKKCCERLTIPTEIYSTEHFFTARTELAQFFSGKKTYLMESFYRHMRKRHNMLMDEDKPIGGQWNFDHENRKKLPAKHTPIAPIVFKHDVNEIVSEIEAAGLKTIGNCNANAFIWPINRRESLEVLEWFLNQALPLFGTYQDALTTKSWSVYHSRLSFSLNTKMLSPQEVCNAAIEHWFKNQDTISLAQVEGFIRQILGWREFMRGVYWAQMPAYANQNFFGHKKDLPDWFWTGNTKMHCMRHAIKQSLEHAYAHHIQRLMVTGNFALLAGINPDAVDEWYLGIYIDAIEWVEITNTRGMSQFADGGLVASKPYVSSGNYINKMSDYCSSCYYQVTLKTGEKACPFNSLYWHFFDRNRELLEKNPRIGMAYRTWDHKMHETARTEILEQANSYLENINAL